MKKLKPADGTYILLYWEDGPDAEYIYGHVSETIVFDTLREENVNLECMDLSKIQHIYGRWAVDGTYESGKVFREYETPGRGRFKITRIPTKSAAAREAEE